MLRIDISGNSLFHAAAPLRFSKIRQQTMLCATRANEAVTPPYTDYVEKEVGKGFKMVGALLTGASAEMRSVKRVNAESDRLVLKIAERGDSYQTTRERRLGLTVVS